jgi:glycosyltransferase involved in cell wall biosynthesis
MAKVSVVIPVYNTEKYLKKAIDSCLKQTHQNLEIIIVNDGSTDNSSLIIQEYGNKYKNIHLIQTENRGLSEARNTGAKYSSGDYLYFLDSDDWILPDMISKCTKEAEKNNLDLVLFDSQTEFEKQEDFKTEVRQYERNQIIDSDLIYSGEKFVERYLHQKAVLFQHGLCL